MTEPDRAAQFAGVPSALVPAMRRQLPALTEKVIRAVRSAIPEYARPMDGPYGDALRQGVGMAMESFIDLVADPTTSCAERDEVFRQLGRYEAHEGRSLDDLQQAYRIGTQLAWNDLMKMSELAQMSPQVTSQLVNAILMYTEELVALSVQGYKEAIARSDDGRQSRRRRLARILLEQPPPPEAVVAEAAMVADWTIPRTLTPVAVLIGQLPSTDLDVLPLDEDMIGNLDCKEPSLIVPGPMTEQRREMLVAGLRGARIAIGPEVPVPLAADSLRWARRALELAARGIVEDKPVIDCDRILVTLWLLSDETLANVIVRQQLAKLESMTPGQRDRVVETLSAWFETDGNVAEISRILRRHPQTIRIRMKHFEESFGELLTNPRSSFALELALRALRLLRRDPRSGYRS